MLRRTARLAIFATLLSLALFAPSASAQTGCTMTGTAGPDTLVGTSGPDVICGLGGDDLLLGEGGNDTIHGGDGNDRLEGGDGEDVLNGDLGRDVLLGGADNDTLNGGGGDDPEVDGEGGNDAVNGGSGDDTVRGGEGDDTVHGDAGRDRVSGGPGDDDLFGDGGNDEVFGVDGNGGETVDCGAGSGDRANGDPGDIIGSNCEGRIQSAELAVVLTDDPDPVDHFDATVLRAAVTNAGTMPAFSATLHIDVGAGLAPVVMPADCSPSGPNDVVCNLGDIAPGATLVRNISAIGQTVGTWTSMATTSSASPETFTGNNSDIEQTTVTPIADLIADAHAPGSQPNGTVATWRGEVSNAGPDPAANTVMTMTFGSGVSIAGPLPAGCTGTGPVVCSIGTLAAGANTTRDIPVRADQTGNTSFTVNVTSDTKDPNLGNNSVNRTINVTPNADLDLEITDSQDPVPNGSTFTYEIKLINNGPDPAVNAGVGVIFDGIATPLGPLPSGCTYDAAPRHLACAMGTIAPGDSVTKIVTARANAVGTESPSTAASSSTPDADGASDDETTTVVPAADLATQLSAPASAGEGVPFPIDVFTTNYGPDVAFNAYVRVQLPVGMQFTSKPASCSYESARAAFCPLGDLNPGLSPLRSFTAISNTAANYAMTAFSASTTQDPDGTNNSATDTITITP